MSDHDAALDGQKGTVAAGRRRAETPTGGRCSGRPPACPMWHAAPGSSRGLPPSRWNSHEAHLALAYAGG